MSTLQQPVSLSPEGQADRGSSVSDPPPEGSWADHLTRVIERSAVGVVTVTPDGTITGWNAGAANIFGYAREEAIGQSLHLLRPPGGSFRWPEVVERLRRGEEAGTSFSRRLCKDGREIDVAITHAPFQDPNGRLSAISAHVTDLTAVRAMAAEYDAMQERYRHISTLTNELIFSVHIGSNGAHHTNWSVGRTDLFGRFLASVDGYGGIASEVAPAHRTRLLEVRDKVLSNKSASAELIVRRDDGEYRWVELVVHPRWGERERRVVGNVASLRDIHLRKTHEQALQRFSDAPILGVATWRPGPDWIEVNDAFCAMLGYTRDELLRESWQTITHPDDADNDRRRARESYVDGTDSYMAPKRLVHKNGSIIYATVMVHCIRDAKGEPDHLISLVIDNTGQVNAQQALQRFIDAPLLGVATSGPDGRWLEVNDTFCSMLAYSRDELVNMTPFEITHPDDRESIAERIRERLSRGEDDYVIDKRLVRKDGAIVHAIAMGRYFRNARGEPDQFVSLVLDRTEQVKAQSELERRAKSLAVANEALEQFAHAAAHDLREPLRGIQTYAQLVEEEAGGALDNDAREALSTIGQLGQRMEAMVDALRAYSRIGVDPAADLTIDLNSLVENTRQQLVVLLSEGGVDLRVPAPLPTVRANGALATVVQNLVANAARYNDKAERWVEITASEDDDAHTITVRDNGVGIAKRHRTSVFGMFKRLHPRGTYGDGSGAGLAIAKKAVQSWGGRIWVESEPNAGSAFRFTVPKSQPSLPAVKHDGLSETASNGVRRRKDSNDVELATELSA